jgi:hypothetical protein
MSKKIKTNQQKQERIYAQNSFCAEPSKIPQLEGAAAWRRQIAMSVIRVDRVPLGIESRAPTVPQRSVQTCSPVSRAHDERKANRRIQAITDSGQCFRIARHIAL